MIPAKTVELEWAINVRFSKGFGSSRPFALHSFSVHAHYCFDTMSASFATVFMLRAVPDLAAGIFNFERPIPLP